MAVAAMVSVSLAPDAVSRWMLQYPETLGIVLATQFVLGRYTGYRLTELYRFGDFLSDEPTPITRARPVDHIATTNGSNGVHAGTATVSPPKSLERRESP
jgi:hypothetical protein